MQIMLVCNAKSSSLAPFLIQDALMDGEKKQLHAMEAPKSIVGYDITGPCFFLVKRDFCWANRKTCVFYFLF